MKKEYELKKMKGHRRPGKAKATADASIPAGFRIPLDIKAFLEAEGERRGVGYQSALWLLVRERMNESPIEKKLEALEKRLDAIAGGRRK